MLKSKVALITGSTSGIGLGIAHELAGLGCHIVLNGLGDPVEIETTRALLEKQYDVEVYYHGADMESIEQIQSMMDFTEKAFGGLDILVNNAGVQHVAPVEEFDPLQWERIIGVNLSSVFHTSRLAIPSMKSKGWGRIINVASIHSMVASPFKSAYVAAKHGVAGLTKTVALETARSGITCNAICPGYVMTPLVENQIADTAKARKISEEDVMENVILGAQPTKQFTRVDDIAAMVSFLCSSSSSNITGSLQTIDGGYIAA